ncbi:TetR/AcrR family transcriptional regulator [Phreatobacter aquaticus]|nr:TetR/AcrR family transcriptional regulator [Phreatobacter aquaticus]
MTIRRAGVRAEKKAARPAEILEATFQEFLDKGYDAARVEDIAARLGISKGAVYFYFGSKEALFAAMIGDLSTNLMANLAETEEVARGSATERLRACITLHFRRVTAAPRGREVIRFLLAEGRKFPDLVDRHFNEFAVPVFAMCQRIIADGIASGEFKPSAAELHPQMLLSPILAVAVDLLIHGDRRVVDEAITIEGYLKAIFSGISATPDPVV